MEIWPQMPVGVLNRSLGSPHHEYPASQIAAETQCSSRYFSEKVSVAISVELWYMGPVKDYAQNCLQAPTE